MRPRDLTYCNNKGINTCRHCGSELKVGKTYITTSGHYRMLKVRCHNCAIKVGLINE